MRIRRVLIVDNILASERPGKVTLAKPPRQHVNSLVQYRRYLRTDKVRSTSTGTTGQELPLMIVATVLSCGASASLRQKRAHAVSGSGFIDIESLRATTNVSPPEILHSLLIPNFVFVKDIVGV